MPTPVAGAIAVAAWIMTLIFGCLGNITGLLITAAVSLVFAAYMFIPKP